MRCENTVTYYVASGYSHKAVEVSCGRTDPYGGRALCEACQENAAAREEHRRILEDAEADNAWLASAGWGES